MADEGGIVTEKDRQQIVDVGLKLFTFPPVNLDADITALDVDNLREWGDRLSVDPAYAASRLLPDRDADEALRVVHCFTRYAALKSEALRLAFEGNAEAAQSWQGKADAVYNGLPRWAKWDRRDKEGL